jgi:4-hydroxy-tetrahydrodipicolinate synthase
MKNALFGGVNVAVLTPMGADLAPDLDRMAAHCRWLLAHGASGLGILGTTGEANSLGISERIALMEGIVARGIAPACLLPGLGTTAITDTVLLLRRAAALGCRGALLLPPFFYKNPSEDGLFAYFSEVIDRALGRAGAALAIYLYHFPAQSAVPFTVSFIARLRAAFPGVIRGIKDSSGDFANTRAYVEAFAAEGFEVYCGDDGALHDLLAIGGAGSISAASNVSSALNAEVVAHAGTARAAGPIFGRRICRSRRPRRRNCSRRSMPAASRYRPPPNPSLPPPGQCPRHCPTEKSFFGSFFSKKNVLTSFLLLSGKNRNRSLHPLAARGGDRARRTPAPALAWAMSRRLGGF